MKREREKSSCFRVENLCRALRNIIEQRRNKKVEFRDTDKSGLSVHDPGAKESAEKEPDNLILFLLKAS